MSTYSFPPLYQRWIEELLPEGVPDEKRATCMDCVMCKRPEPSTMKDRIFKPSVKCCSYNPVLPNFLIGGILDDQEPSFAEGKALFEREAVKLWISAESIGPNWMYWIHYHDAPFGEVDRLRCPYYIDRDGGLCGIWNFRNSRCTTWFCKYNRGDLGHQFWFTLSELLANVEKTLSEWCIRKLNLEIPLQPVSQAEAIFGNWAGKEREFYINCYLLVEKLKWSEVQEILDSDGAALLQKIKLKHREMLDESIPAYLRVGEITYVELSNDNVRVWGFGTNDPIDIHRELFTRIQHFDGPSADLDSDLVRRLYELRILVAK